MVLARSTARRGRCRLRPILADFLKAAFVGTAVDNDVLTDDVGSVRRAKESADATELGGVAEPTRRNTAQPLLLDVINGALLRSSGIIHAFHHPVRRKDAGQNLIDCHVAGSNGACDSREE